MQQAWEERHVTLSLVSVSRHINDIIIDIIIDCVHKPPQANIIATTQVYFIVFLRAQMGWLGSAWWVGETNLSCPILEPSLLQLSRVAAQQMDS